MKRLETYSLRDVDRNSWNKVLERSKEATIFHTLEWIDLQKKSFGFDEKLSIYVEEGEPIGIFPYYHRKIAFFNLYGSPQPETGSFYGGPLSIDSTEACESLIKNIGEDRRNAAYFMKLSPHYDVDLLRKLGYEIEEVKNFLLDLSQPEDALWTNLNKKSRNQVRKAKKMGVELRVGTPLDLDQYYDMILETCERNSLNPLPLSFYKNVFNELYEKKMMRLSLAYYEGQPIAGAIFLLFKDKIIYWQGDSFSRFWHLNPNDLLQWDIIKWGKKNGYKTYDLGGAGVPSIAKFKAGWGGKEIPFYRAYKGSFAANLSRNIYARLRKYPIVSKFFRGIPWNS